MRCPKCEQTKTLHTVYLEAQERTTYVKETFWDMENREHVHDPNFRRLQLRCSSGHRWVAKTQPEPCLAQDCTYQRSRLVEPL